MAIGGDVGVGGGGGGLHFRSPPDRFTGASLAAARTARNTYFTAGANSAALRAFQADQSLAIILSDGTDQVFETYAPGQEGLAYSAAQWVARVDAVQSTVPGPAGPGVPAGGDAGDVLLKRSGTDRDTHFGSLVDAIDTATGSAAWRMGGDASLTQAEQLGLLIFSTDPAVIPWRTSSALASAIRSIDIHVANPEVLTGDIWVQATTEGLASRAREKWTNATNALRLTLSQTNANTVATDLASGTELALDLAFYDAATGGDLVDSITLNVPVVRLSSSGTPTQLHNIRAGWSADRAISDAELSAHSSTDTVTLPDTVTGLHYLCFWRADTDGGDPREVHLAGGGNSRNLFDAASNRQYGGVDGKLIVSISRQNATLLGGEFARLA